MRKDKKIYITALIIIIWFIDYLVPIIPYLCKERVQTNNNI